MNLDRFDGYPGGEEQRVKVPTAWEKWQALGFDPAEEGIRQREWTEGGFVLRIAGGNRMDFDFPPHLSATSIVALHRYRSHCSFRLIRSLRFIVHWTRSAHSPPALPITP